MKLAIIFAFGSLVHAAPGTLGFALGTKMPDGKCKTTADYEADFDAIAAASSARLVRQYAAADCDSAKNILPAAKTKSFKVVLAIWPDVSESYNKDRNAIAQYAPQYKDQVWGVSVGSETLYRKNFTGEVLASKMQEVKDQLKGQFRIGTADTYNRYADGTADAVIKKADFLFINAFPFWQGMPINNATHTLLDDAVQAFSHIEKVAGANKIDLWIGETGWPTDSSITFDKAIGGVDAARTYWQQGICAMIQWGYNVFSFEAFDEPWKPVSIGDNGLKADETKWGVFPATRGQPKFPLTC